MKIPLLNEIHPFDNSVNTYRSNSGYTFENRYSEKPDEIGNYEGKDEICTFILLKVTSNFICAV